MQVFSLEDARTFIAKYSFGITAAILVFFFIAPQLGYPMEPSDAYKIFRIALPVFLGYLTSAAHFLFGPPRPIHNALSVRPLFALMVKGPIYVVVVAAVALLVSFGLGNRLSGPKGGGLDIDFLATGFSVVLGILTVTTTLITAQIFATAHDAVPAAKDDATTKSGAQP